MRLRFFNIIFWVLLTVGISSSLLYNYFLHQERIRLIDQQVRETATALLSSELAELSKIDIAQADEIISEELGENRIGKFFILRKNDGVVLYESMGAKVLPIKDVPQTPQWITLREKGQYIRVLNLALPRLSNRTLQVGLVLGEDILAPPYLSKNTLIYILSTVAIGLLISFFLTSILLKPLSELSLFLKQLISGRSPHSLLSNIPSGLFKYSRVRTKDEFIILLNSLNTLIDRINKGYKTSRAWSYQMAHELKTPLAIMEMDLEIASRQDQIDSKVSSELRSEIKNVSETISTFLSWAEIENLQEPKYCQEICVSKTILDVYRRLSKAYPGRLRISILEEANINCIPQHLELLIQNLVLNSLKYAHINEPIVISMSQGSFRISDKGPGIPKHIVERIGEPFNFDGLNSEKKYGSGLGLAFVYSVAHLYDWEITLNTNGDGTAFDIQLKKDNRLVSSQNNQKSSSIQERGTL